VPPQLARQAITTYTDPGDLVVDLTHGSGMPLVEAIKLGRNAIAVARDRTEATRAAAALNLASTNDANAKAAVVEGNPRDLPRLLTRHRELLTPPATRSESKVVALGVGRVDLIVTSSPSHDRAAELYAVCAAALKPGGFLVTVPASVRAGDARDDPAGDTVAVCAQAGLLYWQHVIALRAPIRESKLTPGPVQRLCHWDVLVFRKTDLAATATAQSSLKRRAA
jgi:SAM-dependent methyltransferase